jgi:uncharacterized membrane protein
MTHATAFELLVFGMLGLPMLRADAFLDVNGVYTTIAVPGAEPGTTVASSINDLGQIAGWFVNGSGTTEGFVDTNGVFTTFGPPPSFLPGPPASFDSQAPVVGINDAGQVVGNSFVVEAIPGGPFVFLYANGVSTILAEEVGTTAEATGINNSGQSTVGNVGSFLLSGILNVNTGSFTELLYMGNITAAWGINNAGEVVGVASGLGDFLWLNGTFTPISLPGQPSGINDSGQIIGNAGGIIGNTGGFGYLDTNGVIQTIDVPGSTGTVAYGINDAGDIVGTFTPVPEPASLLLAAAGLAVIALLKRYRAAHCIDSLAPASFSRIEIGARALDASVSRATRNVCSSASRPEITE